MISVVKPGLSTTVQDAGREGYYNVGIPPSGALDGFSLIAANLLVGNDAGAAGLECAYLGPELEFSEDAVVAVAGAEMTPKVDGSEQPLWEAFSVGAGSTLSFAHLRGGARAYVAVAGGIDVPELLGSRSTYVLGGLGGFEGRPLAAGDSLPVGSPGNPSSATVPEDLRPAFGTELEIRVVMGLYDHLLTDDGRRTFEETVWTLTPTADRVGFRYKGEKLDLLEREQPFGAGSDPSNIVDAPYPIGSIQVPGGVEPIVLHRDAVSGGGYAMIATVISADMDAVAQSAPGAKTRFVPVDLDGALAARAERNRRHEKLREVLSCTARAPAAARTAAAARPAGLGVAARLALGALFLAVAPAPAAAQLRALAPEGAGPALADDRVVWGTGEDSLHVVSAPVAGGEAVALGDAPAGSDLAAAANGVAVVDGSGRLFTAGPAGPFHPFGGRAVGEPPIDSWIPALQMTSAGVLTLEDDGVQLRGADGGIREVAVPPGADPTRVAAAGDLAVAPTPEGALTIFDVRTDIERGQVSLGRFDPNTITGLSISPEGDVAATVPVGDGDDVLLWAPAGATRVRELSRGHEYSRVAVGGGRVAFVAADGLREGVRAFVIDPRSRRIVFRGPPAFDVSSLGFDGRNIAFALPGCLVAGPAVSRRTIPPGPCSRTDVAVDSVEMREGRVRVRVACINAPRRSCRVTARVRTRSGRVAGRLAVRVPVGSARVRAIRLNRHGRARGVRLQLTVRVAS